MATAHPVGLVDPTLPSRLAPSVVRRARARRWRRAAGFWVRRYLPPELAGTATMLAAGLAASVFGAPVVVVGIISTLAESVGFYALAARSVWREQRRVATERSPLRALGRTLVLLLAEFGPAEVIDTLIIRPVTLIAALALIPNTVVALLVGKVAADIVFYVLAATAFRVTEETGLRGTATEV